MGSPLPEDLSSPGFVRQLVFLLAFASSQSQSCEISGIDEMKRDIEAAFSSRTLAGLTEKYGGSEPVELTLENEYDEESPVTILTFDDLAHLAVWFDDKHEHAAAMIVPDGVICTQSSCAYQLPELALHHGTYLLGFAGRTRDNCRVLTKIAIHWG